MVGFGSKDGRTLAQATRALAVKVQSLISSKLIISLMNYAAYLFQVKQHEDGDICNNKKKFHDDDINFCVFRARGEPGSSYHFNSR